MKFEHSNGLVGVCRLQNVKPGCPDYFNRIHANERFILDHENADGRYDWMHK